MVVAGSLSEGIEVRLDAATCVEDIAVGSYVVVAGERRKFFGMITDVRLSASNPQLVSSPPDVADDFIAEVIAGTSAFGVLEVMPTLTIEYDGGSYVDAPRPVKTVPSHFAVVAPADKEDVAAVFGREDQHHFVIGKPLDMDVPVCLNLQRFVERSSGIFGKSGTGKTFLTRLLLIGIAQKGVAVNLVFDMHNEYGHEGTAEGGNKKVKGLKQLFQGKVAIFSLDVEASRRRNVSPDAEVEIGFDQIQPDDIAMVREAFGITEAGLESAYRLARHYGDERWLAEFLDSEAPDRDALAQQLGLNSNTLNVLHRKLENRLARLPFIKRGVLDNSVDRILEYLNRGVHVVLEFGRHRSLDAYILVANVLTRRIYDRYVEKVDLWMGGQGEEPKHLVITIEEAHKFLSPQVADLTIFGTIARELRKYHVTLLVVDQRPSSIADEVMSQIGSRVTCLLDDEKDISAVLSGISGAQALRGVLAKLDSKQQAIVLGHAVPTPVVIRTRDYGTPESYKELRIYEGAELRKQAQKDIEELFG
jgi:DNA helicase HerA-like ATPase